MSSIFLSHTHADKPFVRRLAQDLQVAGVRVWLDEAEMMIGDSLIEKIREGIDQMEYLGVILSQHSVKSEWVKREVDVAMNQEIEGKRVKVLPLVIDDCELPGFLKGKLYADFRVPEQYEEALGKILRRLGIEEALSRDELAVLRALAAGKEPLRSRFGIATDSQLAVAPVEACLTSLVQKGLASEVQGKKGIRWGLTPKGRECLEAPVRAGMEQRQQSAPAVQPVPPHDPTGTAANRESTTAPLNTSIISVAMALPPLDKIGTVEAIDTRLGNLFPLQAKTQKISVDGSHLEFDSDGNAAS